ncbi:MAG: CoA transferase [Rhodospirillaceae bacterium]|nr:CoA transferase [Rhodospirillaceae bacterium]
MTAGEPSGPSGPSDRDREEACPQPLAGLKVLDMAHVLAGPSCGWMLAMLGAEVIKVEPTGEGDLLRVVDEDPARRAVGMGLGYQSVNAGKRSLAVDFKTAVGREIVLGLADRADVLVQSFRAGALDALGLGPDKVTARNPRLVYCAISGFGQDGPRRGVRAFDHVIQAASGIMALTGAPDGGPQKVGTPVSDTSTGVMAAFAILAALHERQRTGRGRFLDVSMLHTMFALMAPQVVQTVLADAPPVRVGNSAFTGSPTADCFRCADADILIGANTEAQFAGLMKALGRGDLAGDSRFDAPEARKRNRSALRGEIESALATQTADHWERVLAAAGIPASVVRTLHEALQHPQFAADPATTWMESPGGGPAPLPNLPFRLDRQRPAPPAPPPSVGADSRAILAELGYTAAAIDALIAEKIVGEPAEPGRDAAA